MPPYVQRLTSFVAGALALGLMLPSLAAAYSYVPVSDAALLRRADLVVLGRVLGARVVELRGTPYTEYKVAVVDGLKGRPGRRVRVQVLGGELADGRGLYVPGAPRFAVRDEVLLFLSRHGDDLRITEFALGAFHVVRVQTERLAHRVGLPPPIDVAVDDGPDPGWWKPRRLAAFVDWIKRSSVTARELPANYFSDAPLPIELQPRFSLFTAGGSHLRWENLSPVFRTSGVLDGDPSGGGPSARIGAGAWNAPSDLGIDVADGGGDTQGFVSSDDINSVVFGDPSGEIDGSFPCGGSGTLALGGYWYNGSKFTANGETFTRILEGDIVLQDGIACALGGQSSYAQELLGHEFGHTIGVDHSGVGEALMWPYIHGDGRGASLHSDDISAIEALRYRESGPPPPPPATAPGAPQNLRSSVVGTGFSLAWDPPGSGGAVSDYVVEVGSGPGAADVTTAATGGTSYQSSLPPATYFARVYARNQQGSSGASNEVQFSTQGGGGGGEAPGAPANLQASVSGMAVSLAWEAPSGGGEVGDYVVQVGASPGAADVVNAATAATSYQAAGLLPGGYFARVFARNQHGSGPLSNQVSFEVISNAPPEAPSISLPGKKTNMQFPYLQWPYPREADGFEVRLFAGGRRIYTETFGDEICLDSSPQQHGDQTIDRAHEETICAVTDPALRPGPLRDGTYELWIRASNRYGSSEWATHRFTVKATGRVRKPKRLQPATGAQVARSTIRFSWRPQDFASEYRFEVGGISAVLRAAETCSREAKECAVTLSFLRLGDHVWTVSGRRDEDSPWGPAAQSVVRVR